MSFMVRRTHCYVIAQDILMYFSVYCNNEWINKGVCEFLTLQQKGDAQRRVQKHFQLICGGFMLSRNVALDCLRKTDEYVVDEDTSQFNTTWQWFRKIPNKWESSTAWALSVLTASISMKPQKSKGNKNETIWSFFNVLLWHDEL